MLQNKPAINTGFLPNLKLQKDENMKILPLTNTFKFDKTIVMTVLYKQLQQQ